MPLDTPPYYVGVSLAGRFEHPGRPDAQPAPASTRRRSANRSNGSTSPGELGSVFGHLYLSGGNLAECFVGGRIAGREAAAQPPLN